MFCQKCGTQLDENNVCPNCGTKASGSIYSKPLQKDNYSNPYADVYSGKSIAGFVVSLIGLLLFPIPCGILGLIFSGLGMRETDKYYSYDARKGRGLAIAGIVISIIDIVFGIINLITISNILSKLF